MKNELLKKASDLKIEIIGKEKTITMGQIICLASALKISGFDVMRLIGELNNL